MNKFNNVNTLEILKRILRDNRIRRETFTIIITGRVGPTGKTWLCNELKKKGYRAMEMSPLFHSLNLKDDGVNHVVVDDCMDQIIVVLNEILPMYLNKGFGNLRFDPDDAYTFDTEAEAAAILRMMRHVVREYGFVTKADFKDMIGRPADRNEQKYGWDLSLILKTTIRPNTNGFYIDFPLAVYMG